MKYLGLFFILLSCSGGVITEDQCRSLDWFHKGADDAVNRESISKRFEYRKECKEHGVKVDTRQYKKGYKKALKKYCNYKSGFKLGAEGADPHDLCEQMSKPFAKGYEEGYAQFEKAEEGRRETEELTKELEGLNSSNTCSVNSDCIEEFNCIKRKCEHNGKSCKYDRDCVFQGRCETIIKDLQDGDYVRVNVCKFK